MEVKDWGRIEEVFHEALPLDAAARAAYFDGACAGDAALRAEVESLLAALKGREGFLQEPAFDLALKVISSDKAEELTGRLVGPYAIREQLGRGGMGEVYLAEDTRLGRRVALKFLSARLTDDNWAKRQLIKEAQSVAMLEHPNVCAVHGIEESDGHSFIVMQYAEGEPLSTLIRRQLPEIKHALSYAVQIVSAVAEAHAHGIIHRDLKPQNIVVGPIGQVKVLDFGLAKTVQLKQGAGLLGDDTGQFPGGLVVGTVAYMSPEQLRAERLDFRSDVFSLGTVLYELFSGARPFARASKAEVISAILTSEPAPLARPGGDIPPELARIVHKCLEKNKERRHQSASELLYELSCLQNGSGPVRRVPRAGLWIPLLLVLMLVAASAFLYLRPSGAGARTLAVLPISNASADPSVESLSAGLTEDLINKFSRLSALRVKALTVVSGYKGHEYDPLAVGRSLRADAVLTATFVKQGDMLILQTSLVDTSDGTQLWGERYNVTHGQVLDLQEDVSQKVTSRLAPWASEGEKRLLEWRPTRSNEALNEYYQGRNLWEKRSKENIREIMAHYQRATELDASYARPYAGLADCYVQLNTPAYGNMPAEEAMKNARYMALKAVEIDDSLPEAHTSLGVVRLRFEWNWPEAEKEFKHAIALNPEYAWAHYWYSPLLSATGRHEEAIEQSRLANDLAPFSPAARLGKCRAFYLARQYDSAAACSDEVLVGDRDNVTAQYILGYVYLKQGKYADAVRILEKLYAKDRQLAAAPLGFAYGKSGEVGRALKILEDLEEMSRAGTYLPPQERAIIYTGLGDRDKAFAWLERSYAEHFATLIFLTADPIYEDLSPDPRFRDLARRLNLAPGGPPSP
ncbi:MAG: eukaryotic-like serine/threonine-protein kinase [Acidobacteriota bacterium]|jgi:serine/threonine protein kinase/tetratricopeptide (TPR) repeat protein|nr:eukaryotic-like serine/threonine-protein kinase [Acidobacteriota bacterium]